MTSMTGMSASGTGVSNPYSVAGLARGGAEDVRAAVDEAAAAGVEWVDALRVDLTGRGEVDPVPWWGSTHPVLRRAVVQAWLGRQTGDLALAVVQYGSRAQQRDAVVDLVADAGSRLGETRTVATELLTAWRRLVAAAGPGRLRGWLVDELPGGVLQVGVGSSAGPVTSRSGVTVLVARTTPTGPWMVAGVGRRLSMPVPADEAAGVPLWLGGTPGPGAAAVA